MKSSASASTVCATSAAVARQAKDLRLEVRGYATNRREQVQPDSVAEEGA